jgi:hypothetical protein
MDHSFGRLFRFKMKGIEVQIIGLEVRFNSLVVNHVLGDYGTRKYLWPRLSIVSATG